MINYNNKSFKAITTSKNAEVSEHTLFTYKQEGFIITSAYSGGAILKGHLIGTVDGNGTIEMRYHQVNTKGDLMTGICQSKPEILSNGKIRLHETWQWTSGDCFKGMSILEEV